MLALFRLIQAVRHDERGSGVVELAMIAPVLALLTVGIVDITQGIARRMELHDAVHGTLEKVAARNFKLTLKADGEPNTALIEADAREAAGPDTVATVTAWLECDGEEQPTFSGDCPALETPDEGCTDTTPPASAKCEAVLARYVRVRVAGSYRPTIGKVVVPNADGTVPLFAEAAVRVQ
jgi:Flp pilus assembly protein TadG